MSVGTRQLLEGAIKIRRWKGKSGLLFFKEAFEVEATTKKPRNPTWADDFMIRKPRSLMIAGGNAHVPCTSGERPLQELAQPTQRSGG
jgi:hypothetical protein